MKPPRVPMPLPPGAQRILDAATKHTQATGHNDFAFERQSEDSSAGYIRCMVCRTVLDLGPALDQA